MAGYRDVRSWLRSVAPAASRSVPITLMIDQTATSEPRRVGPADVCGTAGI